MTKEEKIKDVMHRRGERYEFPTMLPDGFKLYSEKSVVSICNEIYDYSASLIKENEELKAELETYRSLLDDGVKEVLELKAKVRELDGIISYEKVCKCTNSNGFKHENGILKCASCDQVIK